MCLNLLREIEDRMIKLGWCLEHGDTSQALTHCAEIRSLLIEAAVAVLRHEDSSREGVRARRGSTENHLGRLWARACRLALDPLGGHRPCGRSRRLARRLLADGDRPRAVRRLKLFLPLLAVAILAQATWMSWVAIHEVIEWPIGGYPRSYIAQLGVKSGTHPELGAASLADIPSRVAKNLAEHVAGFTTLPTRLEYINQIWSSPLMIGPFLLVVIGLGRSMWPSGGGLPEWYFVGHEAMYLLWPWIWS